MSKQTGGQLRTRAQAIRDEIKEEGITQVILGTFLDDVVDSLDTLMGGHWEFNLDSLYTVSNKRSIAAGVRTKVTVNGLLGYEASDETLKVWDVGTNKVNPLAFKDGIWGRFAISGSSDTDPNNYFEVEFDVGGTAGIIAKETVPFIKGIQNQSFNFTLGAFAGADFFANGGEIYITPLADASFWEHALYINRTFTLMT